MTRESAQVAAQRAALGKCLVRHRKRNGLHQREIAERMYYDRTSISKIESGQQPAPRKFWCEADRLLGADGELVAGFDALAAAKASDGRAKAPARVRRGNQSADVLAEALSSVVSPVARATAKVRSTPASSDQIEAVIELEALSRALVEHSRRVLMDEPTDWADITEQLNAAATICRHRVVIEPCAAGNTSWN